MLSKKTANEYLGKRKVFISQSILRSDCFEFDSLIELLEFCLNFNYKTQSSDYKCVWEKATID